MNCRLRSFLRLKIYNILIIVFVLAANDYRRAQAVNVPVKFRAILFIALFSFVNFSSQVKGPGGVFTLEGEKLARIFLDCIGSTLTIPSWTPWIVMPAGSVPSLVIKGVSH